MKDVTSLIFFLSGKNVNSDEETDREASHVSDGKLNESCLTIPLICHGCISIILIISIEIDELPYYPHVDSKPKSKKNGRGSFGSKSLNSVASSTPRKNSGITFLNIPEYFVGVC